MTIEPGIYFNEAVLEDLPRYEYRPFINMKKARRFAKTISGIRLEDDVLVTEKGHKLLGPKIPEHIDEIEAIVGK